MATAWYGHNGIAIDPEQCTEDLWQVSLMTWAFVWSMKRHLSPPEEEEEAFVLEINSRLAPAQADAIVNSGHRPNCALYDLSVAIDRLPVHFMRKNEINKNLTSWGGSDIVAGAPLLLLPHCALPLHVAPPPPLRHVRALQRLLEPCG